jgi:hypothetical protein
METLPWELIGQIGANLLPKYRCRLYMCTKLWYTECYLADKWLFLWHNLCKCNILNKITAIKYDIIVEPYASHILSYRIKENGYYVFGHQIFYYNRRLRVYYSLVDMVGKKRTYRCCTAGNCIDKYWTADYDRLMSFRIEHIIKTDNYHMYILIYKIMRHLELYLSNKDLKSFLIACGNNVYFYINKDKYRKILWHRNIL